MEQLLDQELGITFLGEIMPWIIRREGSKFQVVAETTGRVVGTHATRSEAAAQVGALYANVPESEAHKIQDSGPTPPVDGSGSISSQDVIDRRPTIINGSDSNKKKPKHQFWDGFFFPRRNP
jgi:hypothetical protein